MNIHESHKDKRAEVARTMAEAKEQAPTAPKPTIPSAPAVKPLDIGAVSGRVASTTDHRRSE